VGLQLMRKSFGPAQKSLARKSKKLISPDGRTFAMVRRSPATRIMVIQNLPRLVRRLRGAVTESR
jgi:hypothetical protein